MADLILTPQQAWREFGGSRAMWYEAVASNAIPHVRRGRTIWFSRSAAEAWIEGLGEG